MSKKVFIGVGHGGNDPGAVKYITEKDYTLKTAKLVAQYLKEAGVEYKLSRTADVDTDMDSKVAMCNAYNPDLVIDVHYNAGGGTGFEVYYSRVGGTSKTLAENINTEMKKLMKSRGVKTKLDSNGILCNNQADRRAGNFAGGRICRYDIGRRLYQGKLQ